MITKERKVAIVGTGLVGSSVAFSLINQGVCEFISMIDVNHERALGEALDLSHCIEYLPQNVKIERGMYEECGDADAIVISAGAPPKPGQTRLDTLSSSIKIIDSIVPPIMASGFKGCFIVVSNPVDILTHHVWKLSKLPPQRVIGTGTAIDSARLKTILGRIFDVDPRSVQAYCMGEHGDSQMVPWSHVYIGGKPILKIMKDHPEKYGDLDLDNLVKDTAMSGWEIYNRKGTTYYGIAAAAVGIIKAIFHNENKVIPVSTYLDGEYGQKDLYTGVPAILGKNGVEDIIEIEMTQEELEKFENSNNIIKEYMEKLTHN